MYLNCFEKVLSIFLFSLLGKKPYTHCKRGRRGEKPTLCWHDSQPTNQPQDLLSFSPCEKAIYLISSYEDLYLQIIQREISYHFGMSNISTFSRYYRYIMHLTSLRWHSQPLQRIFLLLFLMYLPISIHFTLWHVIINQKYLFQIKNFQFL